MQQNKNVYLNGEYLPLSEAKVSVLDRGFLFGDGIYEVIPVYFGRPFHFAAHIRRLNSSLESIGMPVLYSQGEWLEILAPLIVNTQDQYIYLQITRGIAPKRDHAFPDQIQPTVFAMCSPIAPMENREDGVKAITLDDSRWELCNIKATTLLGNILSRQQAVEQGSAEAILIKNGYVTEGAASNVFAMINQVLTTPPTNNEILPGITRDVILEIASQQRIPFAQKKIPLEALKNASEIWLTSSTREIVPVVILDSEKVADGKPGPVWRKMHQFFQELKKNGHE